MTPGPSQLAEGGILPLFENRSAGHHRRRGRAAIMAALWLMVAGLAGCRPTSEFDGHRYRHRGVGLAVTVPEGWTHTELSGDLVLRLDGPKVGDRMKAMAHVFSREEWQEVDLEQAVAELVRLMSLEATAPGHESVLIDPIAPLAPGSPAVRSEAAEVGGLPARRLVRTVSTRSAKLREETLLVVRGRRAWALVLSVPEAADASVRAGAEEIVQSFDVW